MTAASVLSRRSSCYFWLILAPLVWGCSAEPPAAVPSPASVGPAAATGERSVNSPAVSVQSLIDREFTLEEGFRKLSLADFESFFAKPPKPDAVATWSAVGHAIVCTGKPKGYLYSRETFKDFTLRLELRFAPPANGVAVNDFNPNTGVMIYITEPHKQWPKSLEVQGKFAELATIKENGGAAKVEIADDPAAREPARKPAGEWNALEIISKGGALTAFLNGTKVCESQPSDVSEGPIGLQSEDFEVHFRRLRIRSE